MDKFSLTLFGAFLLFLNKNGKMLGAIAITVSNPIFTKFTFFIAH